MGGLWNGAFFLAEAQLMDGVECAFHPDGRAMMEDVSPKVLVSCRTHVIDRNRITCAGASSSLRMMLELITAKQGVSLTHAVEEILSCNQTCESLKVSRRQLECRFCRFVGATPTRYYHELRLTRARQLILQSNWRITDIAIATGFCSFANLHMRFRDLWRRAKQL